MQSLIHKTPFAYPGAKTHAAATIWAALGDPEIYVEPCCGSARVLFHRPSRPRVEIINDIDGFVANFWRASRLAPRKLARMMDRPSHEIDVQAINRWLSDADRKAAFIRKMRSSIRFHDVEIAAYWCWGMSLWWGHGFCEGEFHGDWSPHTRGTGLIRVKSLDKVSQGIQPVRRGGALKEFVTALSKRLRNVHALCGDWSVAVRKVLLSHGKTVGVFLDPPYSYSTGRQKRAYANEMPCTSAVEQWCLHHGRQRRMRIVLAGFDGEYTLPGWHKIATKKRAGMARTAEARARQKSERLWLSPHCDRDAVERLLKADTT